MASALAVTDVYRRHKFCLHDLPCSSVSCRVSNIMLFATAELLAHYGFCVPHNGADSFFLELPPTISTASSHPHASATHFILTAPEAAVEEEQQPCHGVEGGHPRIRIIPQQLLDMARERLRSAGPPETQVQSSDANAQGERRRETPPEAVAGENRLAREWLAEILRDQQAKVDAMLKRIAASSSGSFPSSSSSSAEADSRAIPVRLFFQGQRRVVAAALSELLGSA